MKNDKLQKSVDRLEVDVKDSVASIISELNEEIEELESIIEKLEDRLNDALDKIYTLENK